MQYIFDVRSTFGFMANMIIECLFIELYNMDSFAYLTYYVTVCWYFRSCREDIELIMSDESDDIDRRISMKKKMVDAVVLHTHLFQ